MSDLSVLPLIMGGVPLPESHGDARTLVGRQRELDELVSLLSVRTPDASGSGPGPSHAVLLSGDAGVGKTRLLTELRDVAVTEGWQVVAGHCLDFGDSALPYLPFSEVMGRLTTDFPELIESMTAERPVLRALQPGRRTMQGAEQDASATVGRADLFDGVLALFEAMAKVGPLLLVIEDVHWADTSTRDLLSFLFSRPCDGRVVIIASYRSDDLHRRHPLRRASAGWGRIPGITRMQLEPLPPREVRALGRQVHPRTRVTPRPPRAVRSLVKQLHPAPLRESAVAGIVARAEGNAFFVEELVGAVGMSRGVPDDRAELLLVRLDRLSESAQQVVRAASVSGRRVSHGLLAEVAGIGAGELDLALREAVELNVLVPTSNDFYRFRHALLAEAVYDDLLPGERVRMHAAYVEALASGRANGTAAELARHARVARDMVTAVDASIRAGDEAMAVGGPDEAADHYQTALELLAEPAARQEVPVDIGLLGSRAAHALIASGRAMRAISVLRELLDGLDDDWPVEQRGRLLIAMANAVMVDENRLDPLEFTRAAFELVPDEPTPLRALLLSVHARAHAFHDNVEEAREFGAEALTLAETQDLPRIATDVLTTLASLGAKAPEDVRSGLEEAVRRATEAGVHNAELRSRYLLGRWHQDRARFGPASESFAKSAQRSVEVGQPWAPFGFDSRLMQAQIATITGDFDEALRLADVSGQAPPAVAETLLAGIVITVRAARGDQGGKAMGPGGGP